MSDTKGTSKRTIKISIYQLVGVGLILCGFIFFVLVEIFYTIFRSGSRFLDILLQVSVFLMMMGAVVLIIGYIATQNNSTIKISIYQLVGVGLILCGFIFFLLDEIDRSGSRLLDILLQVGVSLIIIGILVLIIGSIASQLIGERW